MDTIPDEDPMDNSAPLSGLDPADLLRQGAAEDTLAGEAAPSFHPPSLDEMAEWFPRFEILGLIGQGGMGAVYKVRQKDLDRVVALKILPPAIGAAPGFSDRFTREAKALAKLNHPAIVTLHEFGQTPSNPPLPFILMEFVDGVNLAQLMKSGRIAPREALAIVPQICDALQYAHDHGIVHRDIKPENILLDQRGRVKVADFGIAKVIEVVNDDPLRGADNPVPTDATIAGKILGTPQYMAPEQISHPSDVDHRADIYALGVVFYQMLTGELPDKDLQAPSKKVHIDARLDEIVMRAMEKKPEMRYQTAGEFRTVMEKMPAAANSEPLPLPQRGMFRRWWWMFLVMIPVGAMFGLAAGALWYHFIPKIYEAEAIIEFRPLNGRRNNPMDMGTQFEFINSTKSLSAVSQELELSKKWKVKEYQTVNILKGIVDTQNIRGTDLISIKLRHKNPQDSVDIATAVTRNYQQSRNGEVIVHEWPRLPERPVSVSTNPTLLLVVGSVGGLLLSPLMALILIPLLQKAFPEKRGDVPDGKMRSTQKRATAWIIAAGVVFGLLGWYWLKPGRFYPVSSLSANYRAPIMGRIEFSFSHPDGTGASGLSRDVKRWGDTQWKTGARISAKSGRILDCQWRFNATNPDQPLAMVTTSSDELHWETKQIELDGKIPIRSLEFSNGLHVEIRWVPRTDISKGGQQPGPTQQAVMQQESERSDKMHPIDSSPMVHLNDENRAALAEKFVQLDLGLIKAKQMYRYGDPNRTQAEDQWNDFVAEHPDFPNEQSRDIVTCKRLALLAEIDGLAKTFGVGHPKIVDAEREMKRLADLPEMGKKQFERETTEKILAKDLPAGNQFQIRLVVPGENAETMTLDYDTGSSSEIHVSPEVIVSDRHISNASFRQEGDGGIINITFNKVGKQRLAEATKMDLGRMRLAIFMDGKVESSPVVQAQLGSQIALPTRRSYEEYMEFYKQLPCWDANFNFLPAASWLMEVDVGKTEESYSKASKNFRDRFSEAEWKRMLGQFRSPLGSVTSRGPMIFYHDVTVGTGDSESSYRLFTLKTHFSEKRDAVEIVSTVKDSGNVWKVDGYWIR